MRPVNVYAACGVCEGLRFKKGMNSNEFNKRIRRRPLVGVLALTKLVTKGSKRRAVRFVDHIFVLPKWRKRGIGQSLLRNALEVTPPYYTIGADESKASKNQPLVGVVVRKHAKQQAAARRLFARGGIKGRPVRRDGFDQFLRNGDIKTVHINPTDEGGEDDLEEYREASIGTDNWHTNADAHYEDAYKIGHKYVVINGHGPDGVFLSAKLEHRLDPRQALKRNRPFWNALKEHHAAEDGDGDDPMEIIANADYLVPAYNMLPDGQTIDTVDAHWERLYARERRAIQREQEDAYLLDW